MLRLIWTLSVHIRYFLRRTMPSNIVADKVRTRHGLKWGPLAMLLAIPYLLAGATFRQMIEDGGPGWLNLLVLLCLWNMMKMLWLGPISIILLAYVRWHEREARDSVDEEQTGAPAEAQPVGSDTVEAPAMAGAAS